MPYDKAIFANNLNRYLKIHGENQRDLCALCGVSSSTASGWCTGTIMPRMDNVKEMADHFECSLSDLIDIPATPPLEDESERELLTTFRQLNDEGRERVIEYAAYLVERGRYMIGDDEKINLTIAACGGGIHQHTITKKQLEAGRKAAEETG